MDWSAPPAVARRSQAERTARSDTAMLDAAVTLIVTRGIGGMTLKEVGQLAGYSRAMAGWRFGTKANLCAFVVRAVGEEWLAALRTAVRAQRGLAAIHAATDAHYRFVRDGATRIKAFYTLWFESTGPDSELKQVIANIHERRHRDVEAWIREAIAAGDLPNDLDVRAIAAQFCATIIGIVYQWLVNPAAGGAIEALHAGLKEQMTRALSPSAQGVHTAPVSIGVHA
jgi:AcrR family transcriptional regulator